MLLLATDTSLPSAPEPGAMEDAPNVWADRPGEAKLQGAHAKDVVDEALVVDAGADHGADAARDRDAVEEDAEAGLVGIERHDSLLTARRRLLLLTSFRHY